MESSREREYTDVVPSTPERVTNFFLVQDFLADLECASNIERIGSPAKANFNHLLKEEPHEASRDHSYRSRTPKLHLDSRSGQSRCVGAQRSDHYPLRCIRNRSFHDKGLGLFRPRGNRRKTNPV